jgi:hypothetical protein
VGTRTLWMKSTLSFANGNCVEVAFLPDGAVAVRNSRDPEGPVLEFTPDEWSAFIGGARNGEFGNPEENLARARLGEATRPAQYPVSRARPACGRPGPHVPLSTQRARLRGPTR